MVFRENKGWDGPYIFVELENRTVHCLNIHGRKYQFHITMCKPYKVNDGFFAFYTQETTDLFQSFLQVVVQNPHDPRFKNAKTEEIQGILKRGGFKPVQKNKIPPNASVIGNRFVLTIKEPGTPEERFKARLVLQGHKDPQRHTIANEAPVLTRFGIRLIISTSVILFKRKLWKRDVVQAYMQAHKLDRLLFTPPPLESSNMISANG